MVGIMILQWSLLLFVSTYVLGQHTDTWAVEVHGGLQAVEQLASKYGCENRGQVGCLEDTFEFVCPKSEHRGKNGGGALDAAAMKNEETVAFVEQQVKRKRVKKRYSVPTDPLWREQWPLLNTGQITGSVSEVGRSVDLNVEPVWIQGITGCNSVVAIVDDGVEYTHPDLRENYARNLGYDYIDGDNDPLPTGAFDNHGTAVAGIVGMGKDNGVCGVGVAYGSTITGIRLIDAFELATDLEEANALGHMSDIVEIYSNSWGPIDDGSTVEGPGTLLQRTFEMGVRQGRGGKGSIYVWASGNGGLEDDSCAADGYTSSIYTIGIGSATISASQATYDEDCSGKMAVAFISDDVSDSLHASTTNVRGRCLADFDGTSASTPLASGVIALALEANRNLTWRDVQYLIAYTSNRDSLTGGDWVTNGAGLRVSHRFGFGAIDAEAMVTRARHWISVPEQHSFTTQPTVSTSDAYNHRPITIAFQIHESSFNSQTRIHFLEHVVVQMSLTLRGFTTGYNYDDLYDYINDYKREAEYEFFDDSDEEQERNGPLQKLIQKTGHNSERDVYDWLQSSHTKRGDIKIELTSPQGTKSVLLPYRRYDFVNEVGYEDWPFMSVHHWGENPVGTWTLKVYFKSSSGSVRMSNLNVKLYGTASVPEAVSGIPSQCDPACAGACSGPGPQDCDICRQLRVNSTFECVSRCPGGTYGLKSYCICSSDSDCPTAGPPTTPTTDTHSTTEHSTTPSTLNQNDSDDDKTSVIIAVGAGTGSLLLIVGVTLFLIAVACYLRRQKTRSQFTFVPLHEPTDSNTV